MDGRERAAETPCAQRAPSHGAIALGFALLALAMLHPLALHPHELPLASGRGADAFIGIWNLWWMRRAIESGVSPFQTNVIFAPEGTSLALHTASPLYALSSVPLQWLAGASEPETLFAIYNALALASTALAGYVAYRLALFETGSARGALLAGAIFAFSDFRIANLVRLHALSTEWLALAAWAFCALLRRPSRHALRLWAACVLALPLVSLEYAAYAVPLHALLFAGARIARSRATSDEVAVSRRAHAASWAALAISAALAAPFLAALWARLQLAAPAFEPDAALRFSADLFDAAIPNPRHPLWGAQSAALAESLHGGEGGFGQSQGWLVLLLAGAGAIAAFRAARGRRWVIGALLFWLLSLGPKLHIGGELVEVGSLPQAWLASALPLFGASRTPIRYQALTSLCLALCAARGLAAAEGRVSAPQRRARAALPLALVLFEALASIPTARFPVPELYREIARDPSPGVLLHIPALPARENLLFQTVHGAALIENLRDAVPLASPRARDPFERPEWSQLQRGLRREKLVERLALASASPGADPDADHALTRLRAFLAEYEVRRVVVLRRRPVLGDDGRSAALRDVLPPERYALLCRALEVLGGTRAIETPDGAVYSF
jgi:hypothetical protein